MPGAPARRASCTCSPPAARRVIAMIASDMRVELNRLMAERFEAVACGLADNEFYLRELDEELAHCRDAYVGLAVTEIATFRAELSGPQWG